MSGEDLTVLNSSVAESVAEVLNNPGSFEPGTITAARDTALKIAATGIRGAVGNEVGNELGRRTELRIAYDDNDARREIGGPIGPEYLTTNIKPRQNNRRAK